MTAYLNWVDPQGREQIRELTADELVVGRQSDADIVLNHPSISRCHSKLTRGPEGYGLTDLQSAHGTLVNGRRIE
jgi:pSer/pThr/pTyr-binding forkhead associated (FHA) protein